MYDVLIGLNGETLNWILASLYERESVQKQLFQGTVQFSGVEIRWRIGDCPQFSLEPIVDAEWQMAVGADGQPPRPVTDAVAVHVGHFSLEPGVQGLSMDVLCALYAKDGTLQIQAVGIIAKLEDLSEFDRTVFRQLAVPALLESVTDLLSGVRLPALDFAGLQFGGAQLGIRGGMLCLYARMEHGGEAKLEGSIQQGPLTIQVSRDVISRLLEPFVEELAKREISKSGSENFKIGKASYSCGIRMNGVKIEPEQDPTALKMAVRATPYASARLKLLAALNIGYKGHISPEWLPVDLKMGFQGQTLYASVSRIREFDIILEPAGNVGSRILSSGVVWPLAQLIVTILNSELRGLLKGQSVKVLTVPPVRITICGERLEWHPDNLSMRNAGGVLEITGKFKR